jgi:hypothetical protein
MDHLAFGIDLQGEIEAVVEFSLGAFTGGLATASGHRDEAADEKGILVKEFGEAGASQAFVLGEKTSVMHGCGPPFILIYLNISE